MVVGVLLPFASILILNTLIINAIRQRNRNIPGSKVVVVLTKTIDNNMNTMATSQHSSAPKSSDEGHYKPQLKSKSSEAQLTTMLLSVAFVFVILSAPDYIKFIIYVLVDYRQNPQSFALYIFVDHLVTKVQASNHAINFFLYYLSGAKFQKDLKSLFTLLIDQKKK